MGIIKLFIVISYKKAVLHDACSKLVVGGVSIDMKWFIVVGVSTECVHDHECFHLFKSRLHFGCPKKFGLFFAFLRSASFCRERSEYMSSMRPHVAVIVDHANETTELFQKFGRFHFEDSINFLFPGLQAGWS